MNFLKKLIKYEMLELSYNSVVLRFTTSSTQKTFNGETYQPYAFTHNDIEISQESTSGNLSLKLPSNFPNLSVFLSNPQIVHVKLWILKNNEFERIVFEGDVVSAKLTLNTLELTASQMDSSTTLSIPSKSYSGNCQHALFSQSSTQAACGLDKSAFKKTGIVEQIINARTLKLNFDGYQNPTWLELGSLTLTRTNESRLIKSGNSSFEVSLNFGFSDVVEGDVFEFYPGCDKQRLGHCRNRYNNEINFYGHDRVPGQNPFKDALK